MNFGLSDEQGLLQDAIRGFLEGQTPLDSIREFAGDGNGLQANIWQGLIELGATGVIIPEQFGGSDLGMFDATVIMEAIGRTVAPVPYISTAVLAPIALLGSGSDAQQQDWLNKISAGDVVFGVGLTEATGVRRDAGLTLADGKLSGKALFVIDGLKADQLVLAVGSDTLVTVDANATGLTRNRLNVSDKTRGMAEVLLDQVNCELIGAAGSAADTISKMIDAGRIGLAAESFGAAEILFYRARDYALERNQFERPIGSFQSIKHLCAEMIADLEPCRSLIWYAAYAYDELPEEVSLMACHAKANTQEVAKMVARSATEIHGGMGFTDLMGLHYWLKRIELNRQLLGGPEATREAAAKLQGLVA